MNNTLDFQDLTRKVDKIPFYLLIVINILVVITFFIIMLIMINMNIEYTKDAIYGIEVLLDTCILT